MSFLNPMMLAWCAAAAVPVLIHLLHRPRPKVEPFPALLFLKRSQKKAHAIQRLRHLILLLMRCAALMGLAFAMAEPHRGTAAASGDGLEAAVIVLDNSVLLRAQESGGNWFQRAQAEAFRLVADLPRETRLRFFPTNGRASDWMEDRAGIAAEIRGLEPAWTSAPISGILPRAVEQACEPLPGQAEKAPAGARAVFLIAPRAQGAWSPAAGARFEWPDNVRVVWIAVGNPSPDNGTLADVALVPPEVRPNQSVRITALLRGALGGNRRVELYLDGEKKADKALTAEAIRNCRVQFTLAVGSEGVHPGLVRLAPGDFLQEDDVRHFAVNVGQPPTVLIVNGDPSPEPDKDEVFYLGNALAPATLGTRQVVQLTQARPEELPRRSLRDHGAVVLANVPEPPPEAWARLATHVRTGGGLLIFAGDHLAAWRADRPPASDLLPCSWTERPAEHRPSRIQVERMSDPLFALFERHRGASLADARVTKTLAVTPVEGPDTAVLARLENGVPAILRRNVGRGRVLFCNFTADTAWTDLPKLPAYLQFVHEAVRGVQGSVERDRSYFVGESPSFPQDAEASTRVPLLYGPTGALYAHLRLDAAAGRAVGPPLSAPGVYELRQEGTGSPGAASARGFAVNPDVAGTRTEALAPEAVTAACTGRFQWREATAEGRSAGPGSEDSRPWDWTIILLGFVAVILALEVTLANRWN